MTMLFSAPFMAKTRDQCPVCDGMARLALVEPHPSRIGMEIHTFTCPTCGPVSPLGGGSHPQVASGGTRLHCLANGKGPDRAAVQQGGRADGERVMKTQTDYRKFAEDCVRLAQTASTPWQRRALPNMPKLGCN
jgi:hypothetical protein